MRSRRRAEEPGPSSGDAMPWPAMVRTSNWPRSYPRPDASGAGHRGCALHAWLTHWEERARYSLAAAIAARLIRRELSQTPGITLTLSARGPGVGRGELANPRPLESARPPQSLGPHVQEALFRELATAGTPELLADTANHPRRLPRGNPLRRDRSAVRGPTRPDRRGKN